ncbi:MAG: hypothetical protein N4A37_00550, partial [Prolixibacteraceae bacterium]|nr:hypothetical protein [Prolixibacteraceae bacterium]
MNTTIKTAIINLLLLFSIQLNAQTTPIPFIVKGTGYNNSESSILKIGNKTIHSETSRGLRLTIINKATQEVVYDNSFDTYESPAASNDLATQLNNMNSNQIGFLASFDAWEVSLTKELRNAFYHLGLTTPLIVSRFTSRRPYAAVFEGTTDEAGSAKSIEMCITNGAKQNQALICGFLYGNTFIASGSKQNALMYPAGNEVAVISDCYGHVGIGTIEPKHQLDVNGTIRAKEIIVSDPQTADFVFEEDYNLRDLDEVESFITKNKHLP